MKEETLSRAGKQKRPPPRPSPATAAVFCFPLAPFPLTPLPFPSPAAPELFPDLSWNSPTSLVRALLVRTAQHTSQMSTGNDHEPLPFSAPLRVLRGSKSRSPRPSASPADQRAVLRAPPRPPRIKELFSAPRRVLRRSKSRSSCLFVSFVDKRMFFAPLRVTSRIKKPFTAPLRVLRGKKMSSATIIPIH